MTGVGISEAAEQREVDRQTHMDGGNEKWPQDRLKAAREWKCELGHHGWPGHPFDVSPVGRRIGILAAINFWQCGMRRIRWTR